MIPAIIVLLVFIGGAFLWHFRDEWNPKEDPVITAPTSTALENMLDTKISYVLKGRLRDLEIQVREQHAVLESCVNTTSLLTAKVSEFYKVVSDVLTRMQEIQASQTPTSPASPQSQPLDEQHRKNGTEDDESNPISS